MISDARANQASHGWAVECEKIRCPTCESGLRSAATGGLTCSGCGRTYRVNDGVIDMLGTLNGDNRIAADFYDGPLWPRFRFWERMFYSRNGGERRAREQIFRHLPHLSGSDLLEVAIGDGSNLTLVPEDCRVYGVDISRVQLAGCRKRFPGRDLRLLLAEAESLPFRSDSFDNLVSIGAFNYFRDRISALTEMARVTRPGGLVVVADEQPNLLNGMIGRRIGLPQVDRWILSRFMHLGRDFTDMIDRHRDLKLEPIVGEALEGWQIHSIWRDAGYCIVGRPKKT